MSLLRSAIITGSILMSSLSPAFSSTADAICNVYKFGAKGDGKSDDTAAVQKAINQAKSNKTGGVVFFPPGKYLIKAPLDVKYSYPKGLTIKGSGSRQTHLIYKGKGILFNVEADTKKHSGYIDSFVIKDIWLTGNKQSDTTALRLSQFETPFIISNCRFEQWGSYAVILDQFAMEGTISNCAFNSNNRGILCNGYNDRLAIEKTSFWRHKYESLKICSTRVRVQGCFFGKAAVAVIFAQGPLQAGSCSSFYLCDFEGQQDMTSFIQIGEKDDHPAKVFRGLKFLHCRFGINPKTLKANVAGKELLRNTSRKVHNVPFCFIINRPIKECLIMDCKFINFKKYIIQSSLNPAQIKQCLQNSYELNSVENAYDAKGIHFSPNAGIIFKYIEKNHPLIK